MKKREKGFSENLFYSHRLLFFFSLVGFFRVRKEKKHPVITGFSASCVTAGIVNEGYSSMGKQESRFRFSAAFRDIFSKISCEARVFLVI